MSDQRPTPWSGQAGGLPPTPPSGWGPSAPPSDWGPPAPPAWGPGAGAPPSAWGAPQPAPPPPPTARPRSSARQAIGALAVVALVVGLVAGGATVATRLAHGGGKSFDTAVTESGGRTGSASEGSSEASAGALDDGWKLESARPEPPVAPECAPEGWMEGATDQHRTEYEKRGFQHTEATVVVTTFASVDRREAAAELARSEAYHECVRLDAVPLSTGDVVVEELPPDPLTPGVAFETTDEEGHHVWRFVIGIGVQRAVVTFCGCDTGFDVRRGVALDVAAALAEAQALPSPG